MTIPVQLPSATHAAITEAVRSFNDQTRPVVDALFELCDQVSSRDELRYICDVIKSQGPVMARMAPQAFVVAKLTPTEIMEAAHVEEGNLHVLVAALVETLTALHVAGNPDERSHVENAAAGVARNFSTTLNGVAFGRGSTALKGLSANAATQVRYSTVTQLPTAGPDANLVSEGAEVGF